MTDLRVQHVHTRLGDGSALSTPWWEIDSGADGPVLLIIAAQHGNEVQGTEILRRFAPICASGIVRGRAILLPFGNIPAIRHRRNSVMLGPEEKHTETHSRFNMNSLWPGDPAGNDIERLIASLDEALVQHATHVVDLHCWNHFWAAAALSWEVGDGPMMAEATGMRFVWLRGQPELRTDHTQIRNIVVGRGGSGLAIEFSGQYCVYEREVRAGVRAMENVAKVLGLLDGEPEIPPDTGINITPENTTQIDAPCGGLFVEAPGLRVEDRVEAGQKLGHIIREDDLTTVEITAPVGGWLWRYGRHQGDCDVSLPDQHPWADPGDPLASVVSSRA